ncbi:MAG: hypothetical protein ACYC6Y_07520 [Thermoguttaceae bacterium]
MRITRKSRKVGQGSSGPTLQELQRAVAGVDKGAVLVPRRILRRVIKDRYGLPRLGRRLPHELCHITDRTLLLRIVEEAELGPWAGAELPERVILLPQPEPDELETVPLAGWLTRYWRLLFHCRIHLELEERLSRGEINAYLVRRWVRSIGITEFAEVRSVLIQERLLLPEADTASTFVEFAATYLEHEYFAPGSESYYFPGLERPGAWASVLAEVIDADRVFAATRPRGADAPLARLPAEEDAVPAGEEQAKAPVPAPSPRSPRAYRRLIGRAQGAILRGDLVRTCIFLNQARRRAPEHNVRRLRSDVRRHIARLVASVQAAVLFPDTEIDAWHDAVSSLVSRCGEGLWSPEARLLFDLQKVGYDRERRVYSIDVLRWLRSRGSEPLERPLPCLAETLIHRHLRSALRRMPRVRIADAARQALYGLLHRAEKRSETNLRTRFRPLIAEALREAQFNPSSLVERIAARKLAEELLDRIVDKGFLTLGDLRDAVARNSLKAEDLSGVVDLVFGDQLLRADRTMARALDGVYRHGQFYLRFMQRLSSVAFGTPTGRVLMRYLILPFGGAYVAEAGVKHLSVLALGTEPKIGDLPVVLALGIVLLLLINFEAFRREAWKLLRNAGRGLHFLFRELPRRLSELEIVQRVIHSWAFRWTGRFLVKPLVVTAMIAWLLPRIIPHWHNTPGGVFGIFVSVNLLLNTRLGRDLEEVTTDWMGRAWRWLTAQVIARLFWLIMDVFRFSVEAIERLMSIVDDWLRFRSGEGQAAWIARVLLVPFWAAAAYVVRFSITLLIEPQVNPIKHFPVVTVSHKILLPFIPVLARVLETAMEKGLAYTVAGTVIAAIPGVFGFLAWELRENWQIYAANRPKQLRPVVVGRHGETVRRLLLPGLHSGTIPKRYAKLRGAEEEARVSGDWAGVHKHLRVLEELELCVSRLVQREFLWFLAEGGFGDGLLAETAQVQLTTNRIAVEVQLGPAGPAPLLIQFDAREGRLLAGATGAETVKRLAPAERDALAVALLGFYKAAGIDLVRQEIEAQLPLTVLAYDVDEHGLVFSQEESPDVEIRYPLEVDRDSLPGVVVIPWWGTTGAESSALLLLDRSRLLFGRVHVPWERWVEAWEGLKSQQEGTHRAFSMDRVWGEGPDVRLLP